MLSPRDVTKIHALTLQIDRIYKEAKDRPSGCICHICGGSDLQTKKALLKVKNVVHGYTHRPSRSPHLCWRHHSGWATSFLRFSAGKQMTDVEIDLHFALYLAKQLSKEKTP